MYMYMYIVHVRMYLVGFCGRQLEGPQSKGRVGGGSVCGAPLLIGDCLEEVSHNLCTHTQVSTSLDTSIPLYIQYIHLLARTYMYIHCNYMFGCWFFTVL